MMKFWHRVVLACFVGAAVITWTVLRPALSSDQPPKQRVSEVNIDLHARDDPSEKHQSSPLDNIPDPGMREAANALKGHINVMRKDLDVSGGTSGSKNNTNLSEITDIDLKRILMRENSFKNGENMRHFDRIAKLFGYHKGPSFSGKLGASVLNQPFNHEENVDRVNKGGNATHNDNPQWYNSRTYPPPKEVSLSATSLATLEKVLVKKQSTHKRRRRPGSNIHLHSEKSGGLKSYQEFHNHINQFSLYSPKDPAIDNLVHDLSHLRITGLRTMSSYGTEIKLLFKLEDGSMTLFKPMRFTRDLETHPDHYYFDDLERHQAEIAAYHLDRVMGFNRVPPNAGRYVNLTRDVQRFSDHRLNKTFYRSPSGNVCFYGKCDYYCDSGHSVCGSPYIVEGSCAVMLPGVISAVKGGKAAERVSFENPFARSYSKRQRADWEDDMKFCDRIRRQPPYNSGRRMLDLVDIHIFDFLTGNMDRHHYHIFGNFGNYTSPFLFDNGRGFGKSRVDQVDILVPLYQCCMIRYSTLERLIHFHVGPDKLSDVLRKSLSRDILTPVLKETHLMAQDRRVKIILNKVVECISRKRGDIDRVVIDDGF